MFVVAEAFEDLLATAAMPDVEPDRVGVLAGEERVSSSSEGQLSTMITGSGKVRPTD